jgi:hypothetical protein
MGRFILEEGKFCGSELRSLNLGLTLWAVQIAEHQPIPE